MMLSLSPICMGTVVKAADMMISNSHMDFTIENDGDSKFKVVSEGNTIFSGFTSSDSIIFESITSSITVNVTNGMPVNIGFGKYLDIDCKDSDKAAFSIASTAKCTTNIIIKDGTTSTLVSGDNHAGIEKNNGNDYALNILGNTGTLKVTGGVYGAGIGGGYSGSGKNITISGGNVIATGGECGAGIGGGYSSTASSEIAIISGDVTAIGNYLSDDKQTYKGVFGNTTLKFSNTTQTNNTWYQYQTTTSLKSPVSDSIYTNSSVAPLTATNTSPDTIKGVHIIAYTDPTVSPTTALYDLHDPSAVTTTIDHVFGAIKNETIDLVNGTDFIVNDKTVIFSSSFLNRLKVGITKLTFDYGLGIKNPVFTINVTASTPKTDAAIVPASLKFDKRISENLTIIKSDGDYSLIGIRNGEDTLVKNQDYTISGNTVTINKTYLWKQKPDTYTVLTFDYGMDVNPIATIAIYLTEPTFIKGEGFKYTKKSNEDQIVTCDESIEKFENLLVDDIKVDTKNYELKSDYTTVTLKFSYLDSLSAGKHNLTFCYGDGEYSSTFYILDEENVNNEENEYKVPETAVKK